MRYGTLMADPPWPESGGGKVKRGADRHYPLMKIPDIKALPVSRIMLPNSHVYLWVTNNYLPDGINVLRCWGFEYVTAITWVKMRDGKLQFGLGQYYRGATEQLLFGRRGQPPYRTDEVTGKRAQGLTALVAPRGEHSAKPEQVYQMIEKVSFGPYCELFARSTRVGWESLGLDISGLDITTEIDQIANQDTFSTTHLANTVL